MKYLLLTMIFMLAFRASYSQSTASPNSPVLPDSVGSIGIIGDSISAGAVTHPVIKYDSNVLWSLLEGEIKQQPEQTQLAAFPEVSGIDHGQDLLAPAVVTWPVVRQFRDSISWIYLNAGEALAQAFFNTPEYSWGYLWGRTQGIPADKIYIAAKNGARVAQINAQVDQLLVANNGVLPDQIFIFFTGNDLCANTLELTTTGEKFQSALTKGLEYLHAQINDNKKRSVYVVSYLGVLQVIYSEDIRNKIVATSEGEQTCEQLRASTWPAAKEAAPNSNTEGQIFQTLRMLQLMPANPAYYCPTLFQAGEEKEDALNYLANRIRAYREATTHAVSQFRERQEDGLLEAYVINDTAELSFAADDIAQDCFHLSVKGQVELMKQIQSGYTKLTAQ